MCIERQSKRPSVKGAEVTLSYHRPDGKILTHEKTVKSDGSFRDVYVTDESGIWSVDAKWVGNDEFTPATSGSINFTVEENPWYCSFLGWLPDSLRELFGCR